MRLVQRADRRLPIGSGLFRIHRIRPGLPLEDPNDDGLGPLGSFDHAYLDPGALVSMHEHRNDEIFSYLRKGTMSHEDSHGSQLPLTPTHLSVMNAGRGLSHEESVPEGGEPVEMLQIFVRPRADDLEPGVQHHELEEAKSHNAWRLLAGPEESNAPLTLRNAVWIYDAHLAGAALTVPERESFDSFLYVFSGAAAVGEERLQAGDSMLCVDEPGAEVRADSSAELVTFLIDRDAPASRSGSLSG